jgi:hypothetical protein
MGGWDIVCSLCGAPFSVGHDPLGGEEEENEYDRRLISEDGGFSLSLSYSE